MGTADRKAREKEELRTLILSAAMRLFSEKGIEQTTIRNIADAIDYSVGTVYVYFKDKDAILHALHQQGFSQLGGSMRVLFSVAEPMERLKAMGHIYIGFALQHRDMYDLMFNMKAPMEFLKKQASDEWDEGKATFDVLRQTIIDCLHAGYFSGHQPEPLAYAIWSAVHGMCSLHISHRSQCVQLAQPQTIVTAAYHEFVQMLERR